MPQRSSAQRTAAQIKAASKAMSYQQKLDNMPATVKKADISEAFAADFEYFVDLVRDAYPSIKDDISEIPTKLKVAYGHPETRVEFVLIEIWTDQIIDAIQRVDSTAFIQV